MYQGGLRATEIPLPRGVCLARTKCDDKEWLVSAGSLAANSCRLPHTTGECETLLKVTLMTSFLLYL